MWPLTFDLRTPNSNLTCILVSSTYTSKTFKILPTFLKLLCGNQFEYIMSCDLWPADSKFELDLYFSVIYLHIKNIQNPSNIFEVIVRKPIWIYNELWPLTFDLRTPNSNLTCILVVIYLHIKNIQNPSNIFEVIVRKPIWIYNELWPLTFDLRTPNSNLTCILVSSTYISKISKIRPRFLKLLCGNQFGGRTADGQVQRIMPPPDFVCGGIKKQYKTFGTTGW